MLQGWDPTWTVRRIDARAAIDGSGRSTAHASGVSAVIERTASGELTLAALGPTDQIATSARWAGAPVTDRRAHLLIPGLVNAHAHLDLTHIGPRPHNPAGGFEPWIGMIRRERLSDEAQIAAAVRKGVDLSLAGGTVLVGDIAGAVGGRASPFAGRALIADGRINAVSYAEFFAIGSPWRARVASALRVLREIKRVGAARPDGRARVISGLSAHAPYSVGLPAYDRVFERVRQTPLCTHLAESVAEHTLISEGTGPFKDLLVQLGLWDEGVQADFGKGLSPVAHLTSYLAFPNLGSFAAVHCNDLSEDDFGSLSILFSHVIYCPRASAYFAAERHFGPHRYREMPDAAITLALGTDSIVSLDTPDRIGVWDEMRFLYRRDATDAVTLLRMATTEGAFVLWRPTEPFTLTPLGTLAGLVAIPVPDLNPNANPSELLTQALAADISGGKSTPPLPPPLPELLAIGRV
jgi:cytosine/adenosine deaminase-related metal-dependent hydrolase